MKWIHFLTSQTYNMKSSSSTFHLFSSELGETMFKRLLSNFIWPSKPSSSSFHLCGFSFYYFDNCNLDDPESVCVSVCLSLASDSSETVHAKIIKIGLTKLPRTWKCIICQLYCILTLTFIQGQTDLNHENTKCSIIPEKTVQAMAIKFAVKIVLLKVYIIFS